MKTLRKSIAVILTLAMVFSMAIFAHAESDVTLEIEVTWTEDQLDAFQAILDDYTAQTGVKFNVIAPGEDYETQMKIRMSTNSLPDLWFTHGWSLIRYSAYLADLSGEPWADDVNDAARGVISGEDGDFYVLPLSIALSCICFNRDVLDAAGVDWKTLYTWDDFEAACLKIREAGYNPVIMAAKDSGNAGGLLNSISLTEFGAEEAPMHDQLEKFLDGTVDLSEAWTPIFDMMTKWRDEDIYNPDFMTLDTVGQQQMLGAGEGAFLSRTSTNIGAALGYNPDANLGLIPYPAVEEGGPMSCAVGEGSMVGAWKDSPHLDEAKAFLAWLAQPENAERIIAFDGGSAGLKSMNDTSVINQYYQEFCEAYGEENIYFDNMFDRKYLPNGMWNIMSDGAARLLDGESDEDIADYCQENFESLYEEAHEE